MHFEFMNCIKVKPLWATGNNESLFLVTLFNLAIPVDLVHEKLFFRILLLLISINFWICDIFANNNYVFRFLYWMDSVAWFFGYLALWSHDNRFFNSISSLFLSDLNKFVVAIWLLLQNNAEFVFGHIFFWIN